MISINFKLLLIIISLFILITIVVTIYSIKNLNKYKIKKRFKTGRIGEEKAKDYLIKHGFKILEEQLSLFASMWINGVKHEYEVRIDYLVKKGNTKSIVEVKTGEKAVDPLNSSTRRQLFEYINLYDADNMYLFDADSNKLKEIFFKQKQRASLVKNIACNILVIGIMITLIIFCFYLFKFFK